MKSKKTLRLILGDQLNSNHSWFSKIDNNIVYVMMEIKTETDYVNHHIQKVIGFFAAMRYFANELKQRGHKIFYLKINDIENLQSFEKNISKIIINNNIDEFQYQLPDEYRVDADLKALTKNLTIPYTVFDAEHFFTERLELKKLFEGKKTLLMESFYRAMRKKHNILMQGDKPLHDKWNFDSDNRKKLPKNHIPITPLVCDNDLSEIYKDIKKAEIKTIGDVDAKHFVWPINRAQSLELLQFFIDNCLHLFGTYQDAMMPNEWSLYHSRISFSLNTKLISPKEVIDAAILKYKKNEANIEYNQLEGFVRQIIGWREFMRGVYWMHMPKYNSLNFFDHKNDLPKWFWNGNTKMNCLKHSIKQSLKYAYAHHIQRLMVTGNFALLAQTEPTQLDEWYLGIYIDALDWVEITNTRGMSQFADGGIVGTKPYVSSASYINKMSNYCDTCYYDKNKKVGNKACPFNSLYWNFYEQHRNKLANNPRIGMMYHVWDRMNHQEREQIIQQAQFYINNVNSL